MHADTNSKKPKVTSIIFGWSWSRNGCGLLDLGSLKSAVSEELIDWTDFLHTETILKRLKITLINIEWVWSKNERGLSGHGTLKSAVSEEWIDELNWFFAY